MSKLSKMVDMSISPMSDSSGSGVISGISETPKAPVYPYGLSISLNQDDIAKLNVDYSDWEVGDHFNLSNLVKVTSISEHEHEGGKSCRVELQIVGMHGEEEDGD